MLIHQKMADRLASLAISRSSLQHGISTAAACGDFKWARDNRPALESLDKRIESLVKVLPPHIVAEARELTNASI